MPLQVGEREALIAQPANGWNITPEFMVADHGPELGRDAISPAPARSWTPPT